MDPTYNRQLSETWSVEKSKTASKLTLSKAGQCSRCLGSLSRVTYSVNQKYCPPRASINSLHIIPYSRNWPPVITLLWPISVSCYSRHGWYVECCFVCANKLFTPIMNILRKVQTVSEVFIITIYTVFYIRYSLKVM